MSDGGFFTTIHIMMDVARLRLYLRRLLKGVQGNLWDAGENPPCKDVLGMVVPQVHCRGIAYGNALGLHVHDLK